MRWRLTMALVTAAAGCGDGGDAGSLGPQEQAIHRLDTFTDNTASCDDEGASVLKDAGDHLILFLTRDFGGEALNALVCSDAAGCRSDMRAGLAGGGLSSQLHIQLRRKQGADLAGTQVTTGFALAGTCKNAEVTQATLQRPADGRVRLETRTVIVDHPPDSQGVCWTDATLAAAEGKPCGRLRVITGTRIETL